MAMSWRAHLLGSVFSRINRHIDWYRFPFLLALTNIVAIRSNLRQINLYDTERAEPPRPDPDDVDFRRNRTADGSFNNLDMPGMGCTGARFGRNVPIRHTFGETGDGLLDPNPYEISEKLLARGHEFKPAETLNVLAAAWLQFMVHDWFNHDFRDLEDNPHEVKRGDGRKPLYVRRTKPDVVRDGDRDKPASYVNLETHWWDGSQIYGSRQSRQDEVRTGRLKGDDKERLKLTRGGKIYLESGHLPIVPIHRTPQFETQLSERSAESIGGRRGDKIGCNELAGVNFNWWIGLSALQTLFAREHNVLCDCLRAVYPDQDDDWYFHKSRLINAALLAKIHTVEWTPALLNTDVLRYGMRGQWWGAAGEDYYRAYGRITESDLVSGIVGSPPDHHAAPYAMTEEFVAVYRMHPLLPDEIYFRKLGETTGEIIELSRVIFDAAPQVYQTYALRDVIYSLSINHPGALTLHNYPNFLRDLGRRGHPDETVDVGVVDILRDRERGVPRYCEFRRLLDMKVPKSFEELTGGDLQTAREIEKIYGSIEKVDLLVGTLAEKFPPGFGFGDTAFRIFILMASRRLKSDRFFTTDYRPEVYTEFGIDWINDNDMRSVLARHFPELRPKLEQVKNAFFPWEGPRAVPQGAGRA